MKNIILFFTLLVVSLSACQKEDIQPESFPRYYEFKLNGVEYRKDFLTTDNISFPVDCCLFTFKSNENQRINFSLNIRSEELEEKCYDNIYFQYIGPLTTGFTYNLEGKMNILKMDKVNNFIAGTFSGFIDGSPEIEVVEGRFILDYYNW